MTVSIARNGILKSAMFRLPPLSHRHGSHLSTAESDPEQPSGFQRHAALKACGSGENRSTFSEDRVRSAHGGSVATGIFLQRGG